MTSEEHFTAFLLHPAQQTKLCVTHTHVLFRSHMYDIEFNSSSCVCASVRLHEGLTFLHRLINWAPPSLPLLAPAQVDTFHCLLFRLGWQSGKVETKTRDGECMRTCMNPSCDLLHQWLHFNYRDNIFPVWQCLLLNLPLSNTNTDSYAHRGRASALSYYVLVLPVPVKG